MGESEAPAMIVPYSRGESTISDVDGDCGSPQRIPAAENAAKATISVEEDDGSDDSSEDFEFHAFGTDAMFRNSEIRPRFPVFGLLIDDSDAGTRPRDVAETGAEEKAAKAPLARLLFQGRNSSIGSNTCSSSWPEPSDELSGALTGSPTTLSSSVSFLPNSPARFQKSGSTGSILQWRRIKSFVLGRSHSDGKEKFAFLSPLPTSTGTIGILRSPKTNGHGKAKDAGAAADAYRIHYGKTANGVGRKSFLPYRPEIIGGFRRTNLPF